MSRWAIAVLGATLVLGASASSAQEEPSAQETALARSLFRQGMAAVELRDFETAADRLGRALALRDSPVIRTNYALSLIELGRLVEASEHLRTVVRGSEEGSQARSVAERRLAELEPRIGRLQIVVGGDREGAHLFLDDAPVPDAAIGVPQPADPGSHRVSLVRLEREIDAEEVTVRSGEIAAVALTAPPLTDEERAALQTQAGVAVPAERGGIEEEPWFWILVGVLAAGAIAAAVTAAVITEQESQSRGSSGAIFRALVEWP